jgi:hypothetical protein
VQSFETILALAALAAALAALAKGLPQAKPARVRARRDGQASRRRAD